MEDSESSANSSSVESTVEEDFDWITDKDFKIENKKDYLKYPLNLWREIAYEPNVNIFSMGKYYESRVNKVLKNDVFKSFEFFKIKNGVFKFNLMNHYNVDKSELTKNFIVPDFFIHKIEVEKFNELLEKRKYMMRTFQKLNTNKKYISIIGEIKTSRNSVFKSSNQRKDYIKFIQIANSSKEEELVLMYVYNESYKLFKEDSVTNKDKIFLIICYIPKLFEDDCYKAYNDIIKKYKLDAKEIDLTKKLNKITKEDLIKELNALKKELNELKEELNELKEELNALKNKIERIKKVGVCVITIFILIITFLIQKK